MDSMKPYIEMECFKSMKPFRVHRKVELAPMSQDEHSVVEDQPVASEQPQVK